MATEGPIVLNISGLTASLDLSGSQFRFVKISGAGTVTVCDAITDNPVGVLQNKPTLGQAAEVTCIGVSKVSAGGAVAAGALISTSAAGQALTTTSAASQTKFVVGQSLSAAGAAGGIFTAVVNCSSQGHGGA